MKIPLVDTEGGLSNISCPPYESGRISRMLRELLEERINKCKREIRFECIMPIEEHRLQAQIMAYQWSKQEYRIWLLRMKTPGYGYS
ncbi:MAG: hypothetical protein ACJ72Q_02450 [Nitrososphaeraceae archaeon]